MAAHEMAQRLLAQEPEILHSHQEAEDFVQATLLGLYSSGYLS